jgi:hypothetical protein
MVGFRTNNQQGNEAMVKIRTSLGAALAMAVVLGLSACSDDDGGSSPSPSPTGVDDGAVLVTPTPPPASPDGQPSSATPVPRVTDGDQAITDAVAAYLAQSVIEYVGWCDEAGANVTGGGFCADRPRPTEGVVVVRIGPVGSEYTQELLIGPQIEGDGWVVIGDTPIEYQGERTTGVG